MNLKKAELEELNELLKKEPLDLPAFRRVVSATGANFAWLRKNITRHNKFVAGRIKELLGLQ